MTGRLHFVLNRRERLASWFCERSRRPRTFDGGFFCAVASMMVQSLPIKDQEHSGKRNKGTGGTQHNTLHGILKETRQKS